MNRGERRAADRDHRPLPPKGHGIVGQPDRICAAGSPGTDAMERACELDRVWFQAYPGATEYLRPAIPGEFMPFHSDAEMWDRAAQPTEVPEGCTLVRIVRVYQVAPGQRTRAPLLAAWPCGDGNTGDPVGLN
jgi:hypothetical protein